MLAANDPILGSWTYELGSFSSISSRAQGQEVFPRKTGSLFVQYDLELILVSMCYELSGSSS